MGLAAGLPAGGYVPRLPDRGVMGAILTHFYANTVGIALLLRRWLHVPVQTWCLLGLIFVLISYVIFAVMRVRTGPLSGLSSL